jgi:hypothetical protein
MDIRTNVRPTRHGRVEEAHRVLAEKRTPADLGHGRRFGRPDPRPSEAKAGRSRVAAYSAGALASSVLVGVGAPAPRPPEIFSRTVWMVA